MNGFTCVVVDKISKQGNPYTALEITFPNGYKKMVFLSEPEKFMLPQK